MLYPRPYVYVILCKSANTYYVGSTFRAEGKRWEEHKGGHCNWTRRHGIRKIVAKVRCDITELGQLENEIWMHYARNVCGPENVRGGDVTWCKKPGPLPDWVLPIEFGGKRIVHWG